MLMKTGFILFFGAIFIFTLGQTAAYAVTWPWWEKALTIAFGLPGLLLLWFSLTTGGDAHFVAKLPIPRRLKELILIMGGGYRGSFSWMYRESQSGHARKEVL